MKIILTIASVAPRFGGPSRSVPSLGNALASEDMDVHLISLREKGEEILSRSGFQQTLVETSSNRYMPFTWGRRFQEIVVQTLQSDKPSLLHDNGVWLPTNYFAVQCARKAGVPLVITPRGMLSAWALKEGYWKKRAAWFAYQKRCLQAGVVLHATSEAEAAEFRAVGLQQPIAIIPNGTDLPDPVNTEATATIVGGDVSRAEGERVRTVLFLSRIHPVKGLINLVKAWALLAAREGQAQRWRVVIAGNDEDRHMEEVKAEIAKHALENCFEFVGEIKGDTKWRVYRKADLFVLPSFSENFGIVVAEALAAGIPVITTRGTPWKDLQTHRCGWWTEIGVDPLVAALQQAITISDQERRDMGARGRLLVETKYSWSNAARTMKTVYEWILVGGPKPDCIV